MLSYLAVGVGAVAQIAIFPLDRDTAGLAQAIARWAMLLMPYLVLGTAAVMIRYLPYLEGEKEEAAGRLLLRGLLTVSIAASVLVALNLLVGEEIATWVFSKGYDEDGLLQDYRWPIILVTAALAYAGIITTHLVNFQRIAIPVIFNNLLLKIGLPLLFLGVVYGFFGVNTFVAGYTGLFWLSVVCLVIYALALRTVKLSGRPLGLDKEKMRQLYSVAGFSILGSVGSELSSSLDIISIGGALGFEEVTVYAFSAFAVSVMSIPTRAVSNISAPIVSAAWKAGDIDLLGKLYRETASVLYVAGGYILTGLLVCLPYLYGLMKDGEVYAMGYSVAIFLGLSRIFDCLTSINGTLISYTDYYRWNLVFTTIMGGLNLALNYLFLSVLGMGLAGPALATTIALAVFNVSKYLLIRRKLGISPWSPSLAWTTLALPLIGLVSYALPLPQGVILNILIRGALITALLFLYIRYTSAVPVARRALVAGYASIFGKNGDA